MRDVPKLAPEHEKRLKALCTLEEARMLKALFRLAPTLLRTDPKTPAGQEAREKVAAVLDRYGKMASATKPDMAAALGMPHQKIQPRPRSDPVLVRAMLEDQVTAALKLATAFGGKYEYNNETYGGGIKITKRGDRLGIQLGSAVCEVEVNVSRNEFRILEISRDWNQINLCALPIRWKEESEANGKELQSHRQHLVSGNEPKIGTAQTKVALNELRRR